MSPDEIKSIFALAAHRASRFRISLPDWPHSPMQSYGACVEDFDGPLPEDAVNAIAALEELAEKAEKGLQMSTGNRFHGWVIGSSHVVGAAADMMTSAWGQNTGNHIAAPSASAAETVAAKWILELLQLPAQSSVGFVTGATVANFVCLAAARGEVLRRAGWDVEAQGLFGAPPITVLIGDDAHTTVFSALSFLGLGRERVLRVTTNSQGAICATDFIKAVSKVSGPLIVVLQAGQINTGAFDPFDEIIPRAKKKGAWVHVDGAFGLWARTSSSKESLATGLEDADSWATDGHKWLQTPYDSGFAIVRDELAHRRAMTIAASYLPRTVEGERDPSHYVPELSRRARGFAVWAMIKALGRAGIDSMINRHCAVAQMMAEKLTEEYGIKILNDVVLNQVIVRFGSDLSDEDGDHLTRNVIARIQEDGECFAGGAVWRGRQVMRISVIGFGTDSQEGARSVSAIVNAYRAVRSP
ncbi:pyridoxal phosphate-dependent decarboxylase family protein [Aestuariivirga sp.]|uniref:pyridoxal phosphate-dependent decarboxylase family protein n=1 Tax=Aestuariivirga sp. TaxID=2650926 RepID=UPI0039E5904B